MYFYALEFRALIETLILSILTCRRCCFRCSSSRNTWSVRNHIFQTALKTIIEFYIAYIFFNIFIHEESNILSVFTCFNPFNKASVCSFNGTAIITINILTKNLVVCSILVLPAFAHISGNLCQSSFVIGKEKPVTMVMGSNRKTTSCRITSSFAFRPRILTLQILVFII